MSVSTIGGFSGQSIQQLVAMRAQFDDLQRQLSTGQKSATYAGLGLNRGITVSLNAQLSAIGGYDDAINNVGNRIGLMNVALSRMTALGSAVKAAIAQARTTDPAAGASAAQQTAQSSLDELLGLLNTDSGGHYLFSGRATDTPAVETMDHILNGNGSQAGLKQLISERNQADLGTDGLGRLVVGQPSTSSVSLAEDAVSPFGLKLASVTSTLTNATVSGPSVSPAGLSVDLAGGNPNAGDSITVRFNLPDGTTSSLTLTATTTTPPGANQFTIGATPDDTATNLKAALTTAVGKVAGTALTAASAVTASNDFFSADANNPPQRVAGPPFATATAVTAGTTTNTVIWYTGETGSDPARATASARVDQNLSVSYGARANEDGIRNLVQNMATLAAVNVPASSPNAADLSRELDQRLTAGIVGQPGDQTISNISVDLGNAQSAMSAARTRHQQTTGTLNEFLNQIVGVSNEEVGSRLLALQTRMQASMQTTAMLFQTSLINYIR